MSAVRAAAWRPIDHRARRIHVDTLHADRRVVRSANHAWSGLGSRLLCEAVVAQDDWSDDGGTLLSEPGSRLVLSYDRCCPWSAPGWTEALLTPSRSTYWRTVQVSTACSRRGCGLPFVRNAPGLHGYVLSDSVATGTVNPVLMRLATVNRSAPPICTPTRPPHLRAQSHGSGFGPRGPWRWSSPGVPSA